MTTKQIEDLEWEALKIQTLWEIKLENRKYDLLLRIQELVRKIRYNG
jgi:hypothetical protein